MKLLFDHNLSPRLVKRLADLYPDSTHLYLLGLDRADDEQVWELARREGFLIVTKDADFSDLRRHHDRIEALEGDKIIGVLTLF